MTGIRTTAGFSKLDVPFLRPCRLSAVLGLGSGIHKRDLIQDVPLATETGISLIILPLAGGPLLRVATSRHTTDTHYRHTLQTHSSSFLTQRTYSCSNFVAISSMPSSVASGTPYILSRLFATCCKSFTEGRFIVKCLIRLTKITYPG